jgi:hypothetical protein
VRRLWVIGALLVAPLVANAEPDSCSTALTFASGRSALTPATKHALEPALSQLRTHPQLHVTIIAPDARDPLAKRRGEVVKWFLVDGGIEIDRIEMATGASSGVQLQLVGCTASLTQTVATTLAPARPAIEETPVRGESIVDDASELANLLAGDKPAPARAEGVGRDEIKRPLTATRAPVLTIGNDSVGFRGDVAIHADTAIGGLRLASARLVESAPPVHEESVARTTLSTGPMLGAIQPAGQPVKLDGRQLRALSRCYRKVPGLQPGDHGDVELTFIVDRAGRVKQPIVVSDEDELIGCIGNVMKTWEFPALKKKKDRIWVSVVLTAG